MVDPNPSPEPTPTGTHGRAPEGATALMWCIREDYAGAGKYYPKYESANLGNTVFTVRERRKDGKSVLLVRNRGDPEHKPVARFTFRSAAEAKARAERYAAEQELYLS